MIGRIQLDLSSDSPFGTTYRLYADGKYLGTFRAELFAAAPDMLEALELFAKWQGFRMIEGTDCERRIKAAISKAGGKS